jgi:hypothetical protein
MRNRTGLAVMIFLIHLVCPAYSATIKRLDENVCLDCAGGYLQKARCSAGSPYQNWTFSDGFLKCKGSGECLAERDSHVFLMECATGEQSQKWKVEKAHRLRLLKKLHGQDVCLKLISGGKIFSHSLSSCNDPDAQAVYHE